MEVLVLICMQTNWLVWLVVVSYHIDVFHRVVLWVGWLGIILNAKNRTKTAHLWVADCVLVNDAISFKKVHDCQHRRVGGTENVERDVTCDEID